MIDRKRIAKPRDQVEDLRVAAVLADMAKRRPKITIDWADYMDGSEPAASQTLQWPMPVVWVSEEEAREMFPTRQETARLCICCGAPAGLVQHD